MGTVTAIGGVMLSALSSVAQALPALRMGLGGYLMPTWLCWHATSITVTVYGCWHSAPAAWLIPVSSANDAELGPVPQIGDFYTGVGFDALVLCQVCEARELQRDIWES